MGFRIKITIEDPDKYPASAQAIETYTSPLGPLSDMAVTYQVFKEILKDGNKKPKRNNEDIR